MTEAKTELNEAGTSLVPESKEWSKNVEKYQKDRRASLKGLPLVYSGTIWALKSITGKYYNPVNKQMIK